MVNVLAMVRDNTITNLTDRSEKKKTKRAYPVDDEDLTDAELLLELLGSYRYRIEVAETPENRRTRTGRR